MELQDLQVSPDLVVSLDHLVMQESLVSLDLVDLLVQTADLAARENVENR